MDNTNQENTNQENNVIPLDLTPEEIAEFVETLGEKQVESKTVEKKEIPLDPMLHKKDNPIPTIDKVLENQTTNWQKNVEVTNMDKAFFIKAINSGPIEYDVSVMGGNFTATLRYKSVEENQLIVRAVNEEFKDSFGVFNNPEYHSRIEQYCATVMVRAINGEKFSNFEYNSDLGFEANRDNLKKEKDRLFKNMSSARWGVLFRAMDIFDKKTTIMMNNIENEDFWKPLS